MEAWEMFIHQKEEQAREEGSEKNKSRNRKSKK